MICMCMGMSLLGGGLMKMTHEEAPLYNPESGSEDDAMEEVASDSSSDSGRDEDDEDFKPFYYHVTIFI